EDVSKLSDNELADVRGDKIGFIFQFFYLLPSLTTYKNVLLPMIFRGSVDKERAGHLLDIVGLKERKNHRPSQLSGGEMQRVAIARALANNPKIILADEPTGNLDSKTGQEIINILMDLNKKGLTVVMVTHDMNIAKKADRIVHLKDGKIIRGCKNGRRKG
ncbi:MAG: ABC transporter ATP-binding protein, partial [Candidatus Aenigmatarchaeota archaeon]